MLSKVFANGNTLLSSFPIYISFVFFTCLTAIAKTSSTAINKKAKSGHCCLALDYNGNAWSLHFFV